MGSTPVALGRALRLHPLTVMLVTTAGTLLFGVLGATLAAPVTTVTIRTITTSATRVSSSAGRRQPSGRRCGDGRRVTVASGRPGRSISNVSRRRTATPPLPVAAIWLSQNRRGTILQPTSDPCCCLCWSDASCCGSRRRSWRCRRARRARPQPGRDRSAARRAVRADRDLCPRRPRDRGDRPPHRPVALGGSAPARRREHRPQRVVRRWSPDQGSATTTC